MQNHRKINCTFSANVQHLNMIKINYRLNLKMALYKTKLMGKAEVSMVPIATTNQGL